MKKLSNFLSVLVLIFTCGCQNSTLIEEPNNLDTEDFKNTIEPSRETLDSLEMIAPHEIDEIKDLGSVIEIADSLFHTILNNDSYVFEQNTHIVSSRASMEKFTVYVSNPLPLMPEDEQKMFFKAKFGSEVVDLINQHSTKDYKISTGTTYLCHWDVMMHYVNLSSNQNLGVTTSPKCALHPDTKSSYLKRGYKTEKKLQNDGTSIMYLYSFQLDIMRKDTNKPTIVLSKKYPRLLDSPYNGYEFNYGILTR